MAEAPMTVVETEEFLRKAKPLMSDAERGGTGGVHGRKSGSRQDYHGNRRREEGPLATGRKRQARVIYYYHSERLPLFLLSAYPKNEKANLSKAERNAMTRLVPILVAGYPAKQ